MDLIIRLIASLLANCFVCHMFYKSNSGQAFLQFSFPLHAVRFILCYPTQQHTIINKMKVTVEKKSSRFESELEASLGDCTSIGQICFHFNKIIIIIILLLLLSQFINLILAVFLFNVLGNFTLISRFIEIQLFIRPFTI